MPTILIRFDLPTKFTIVVDGDVRAHIVKEGTAWLLRRLDQTHTPDYNGIDVTSDVFCHHALVPRIARHLHEG